MIAYICPSFTNSHVGPKFLYKYLWEVYCLLKPDFQMRVSHSWISITPSLFLVTSPLQFFYPKTVLNDHKNSLLLTSFRFKIFLWLLDSTWSHLTCSVSCPKLSHQVDCSPCSFGHSLVKIPIVCFVHTSHIAPPTLILHADNLTI